MWLDLKKRSLDGRCATSLALRMLLVGSLLLHGFLLQTTPVAADDVHVHLHAPHDCHDDHCDDDDDGELFILGAILAGMGAIAVGTVGAAPWWAPPSVIEDDYEVDARFPRHPYKDGHGGYVVLDNDDTAPDMRVGNLFVRGSADYGHDFDDTSRLGANIHLETRNRWGLDAEWATFNVKPGGNAPGDFEVGDTNLIFRFAQSEHAQWWTGVGFNWLNEAGNGTEFGYNITYGADVCVGDPWVVSFQLDAGEISHNSYFHGRATIGAQWEGIEVYTGFDYIDANVSDAATMIAGVRLWF